MIKLPEYKLRNIVAFLVLMENNAGLMGKSPDYIAEKFARYCLSEQDETEWGLDAMNRAKVKMWEEIWLKKE